jgi:hypothetical protein
MLEPIVSCVWKWLISEKKRCALPFASHFKFNGFSDESLDESSVKVFERSLKSESEAYRYFCSFKLARAGQYSILLRQIQEESGIVRQSMK